MPNILSVSVRSLRRGTMAAKAAEAPAGTPPVYRAQAVGNSAEVASAVSVTIPGAVEVNDVMLLTFVGNGSDINTPSGWTQISKTTNSSETTAIRMAVFRKTAVSGDTGGAASVSVTATSGSFFYGILSLVAYSGVDTTTPVDVSGVTASGIGQESTTITAPSVTTTSASTKLVRIFSTGRTSYATTSISGPATQRSTVAHSVAFTAIVVSDADGGAAGASGTATATSAHVGSWLGSTIALKAAA